MAIPVAKPKALLADKGYDGDRLRDSLLVRGILPIIPLRSQRKVPERPDYRRSRTATASSECSASSNSNDTSPPVRQNTSLVRERPQLRRHAAMAESFVNTT